MAFLSQCYVKKSCVGIDFLTVIIGRKGPKISSVMISASKGGSNKIVGSMNLNRFCRRKSINFYAEPKRKYREHLNLTGYLHPAFRRAQSKLQHEGP